MSLYRTTSALALAAVTIALACSDRQPTEPNQLTQVQTDGALDARKHRANLTGAIEQTIGGSLIDAVIRVTRLSQAPDGSLLASGVITGTAAGQAFSQAFTNVPATLSAASDATAAAQPDEGFVVMQAGSVMQAGTVCDVLLLDLGPLHLDVLGLVVDLSQVILNIDAVAGSGNLLGNLLCAVVHLLDGPAILAAVSNLLDQVNTILGALGG